MKCACFPKGLQETFKIICGLKLQQISMSCLISTNIYMCYMFCLAAVFMPDQFSVVQHIT